MTDLFNKIKDLKDEGLSFSQIAEKLEISKATAHRIFSQNNENSSENEMFTDDIETNQTSKDLNRNTNPKLIYQLKKLEYEHVKHMKELELDEIERQREFQKQQMDLQNQIIKLKSELEQLRRFQDVQSAQNQINEEDVSYEIEDFETEEIPEITVPKKIRNAFETFIQNIFKFNNTEIDEDIVTKLLEQNITVQKYFAKWIKSKEIEPNEVPHRIILKKLQKILQSIDEDLKCRGIFSSRLASFEIPESMLDEISELL